MSWEPFGPTRGLDPPPAPAPAPAAPEEAPAPAPVPLRPQPARRLAIVTCMDARIDPLAVLGLKLGDANVIRNAGATVSDDVLRSLQAAITRLGVTRVVLMGHTDCAGHGSDAAARASLLDGVRRAENALPDRFPVEALMYDVATGAREPI